MEDREPYITGGKKMKIKEEALTLYKPPFSFKAGYIFDSKGNMFADNGDETDRVARIRGWGRLSYMENPEELQDAIGEHMAIALTEYWNKNKSTYFLDKESK